MTRRLLAVVLASALCLTTQRLRAQDVLVTNLADLAEQAFSGAHSIYISFSPWEWHGYSLDGGLPFWVDCSALPCAELLPSSGDLKGVSLLHGVLTKNVLTGETVLQSEWSTNVIARIPAPSGYQPGVRSEDRWVWWQWQQWTNCPDCWGVPEEGIVPPTVTLKVLLADAQDKPTYDAAVAAEEAVWAEAQAEADAMAPSASQFSATSLGEGGGMMSMDNVSCTITDEAAPFAILSIERDTNGWTTITWESCSDHAYRVLSTNDLGTNWTSRVNLWGEDGSTSWTDATTTNVDQRFYKVERMPLDTGFSMFNFTVNGGADVVTNAEVDLDFSGFAADYVVISESITMSNGITMPLASVLPYTLSDTNDGLHTVFVELMNANGALGPVIGYSFELDTHPPSLMIMSPSNGVVTAKRRLNIEGFGSDAGLTNAPALDASRPLQVTVNGDFVNDRDTNGVWWSGLHDLDAGTNTFLAIATDRAGFSATNSVWFIYDPSLATNVPVFTVDVTNTVVVGSNATSIAVSGMIDDDNATVQIDVLDATDNTITNASVSAAVHGTNWWGEVPLFPGSNAVVVTAQNSASLPATNGFIAIQKPNVWLEITSPLAGTDVNATNVTVTGLASTNLNSTISINGSAASTSLTSSGIVFSGSVPINNVDANVIEVHATGSDGSLATAREIVYGYEIVGYRYHRFDSGRDETSDCWFAHHYPNNYVYRWHKDYAEQWSTPSSGIAWTWSQYQYGLSGASITGWDYSGTYSWDWKDGLPWDYAGSSRVGVNAQYVHLNAGYWYGFLDCPYSQDCNCVNQPYCEGEDTSSCCIDTVELASVNYERDGDVTFIKHWPADEEQTVILHFDYFQYWANQEDDWCCGFDPSQVKLWGQQGFLFDEATGGFGFLIKIRTNTRYTLHTSDFTYPASEGNFLYHQPNPQSRLYNHFSGHMLYFYKFANVSVKIDGTNEVLYLCKQQQQTNIMLTAKVVTSGRVPYPTGTFTWSVTQGSDKVQLDTTSNDRIVKITPTAPSVQAKDVEVVATFHIANTNLAFATSLTVLTPWGIHRLSQAPGDLGSGVGFTNSCVYQVLNQLPDHGPLRLRGLNVHEDFPTPAPAPCTMTTGDFSTDVNGRVPDFFRVALLCYEQLNFTMIQRLTVDCVTNCHQIVCTVQDGIDVKEFGLCQ
jgi:hypothetical protein